MRNEKGRAFGPALLGVHCKRRSDFELSGGAGKTWTQAEQQAAANTTRLLTQEDPPPQTVYRVSVKTGEPLMVKVRLRYSSK